MRNMKLFTQLKSCCRPCPTPPPNAPPSNGGSHGAPLHSAAASRPLKRRSRPHWQPALSSIMEDRVQDHHNNNNNNNVVTKPPKKASVTLSSHDNHTECGKSMPIIMFSPFSMF